MEVEIDKITHNFDEIDDKTIEWLHKTDHPDGRSFRYWYFSENIDPIIVDRDYDLIDGWHRLAATIAKGQSSILVIINKEFHIA